MTAPRPAPAGVTAEDLAFARAFERREIENGAFHHEDHVHLGWICLRQEPLAEAAARFVRMLEAFAEHHGVPGLYHDTITWAYLLLIRERLGEMPAAHDWREFARRNPDLLEYRLSILSRYYRKETLASDRARAGFVMPDACLGSGPGEREAEAALPVLP